MTAQPLIGPALRNVPNAYNTCFTAERDLPAVLSKVDRQNRSIATAHW